MLCSGFGSCLIAVTEAYWAAGSEVYVSRFARGRLIYLELTYPCMCEGQRGEDCIDSSPGQSLPVGLTFITSYYFQAHGYGKYIKILN